MATINSPRTIGGRTFPAGTPISEVMQYEIAMARQQAKPKITVNEVQSPALNMSQNQDVTASLIVLFGQLVTAVNAASSITDLQVLTRRLQPFQSQFSSLTTDANEVVADFQKKVETLASTI